VTERVWKLLLVEDDEDDYILTRDLLEQARAGRFSLSWVKTYAEGRKAGCQGGYDAVIVDYRLGKQDGLELVRELSRQANMCPLILITGQGNYSVDLEAMRAGATDYLVKGEVTPPVLERTLRYAIDRKAAENALREAHAALSEAHEKLEQRVEERTEQLRLANERLEQANRDLRREIGERQRAQEALEASEVRFRKLAETTSSAIFIVRDMTVLYANPAAEIVTGYSPSELQQMPFWQIAHPSYQEVLKRSGVAGSWMSHLAGDIPTRYELKVLTKTGEARWVDITAGPLEFEGEPALVVTAFDITERDLAEEALRQAKNELEMRVAQRTAELLQTNDKLAQANEWLEQANQRLAHELEQRERGISERVQAEEQIRLQTGRVEVQQRIIAQRELERLHIAQDLHDGPLQELLAHTYAIEAAAQPLKDEHLREELTAISRRLHQTIGDLRDFASELRPPALAPFGLDTAMRDQADKFRDKNPHILVRLNLDTPGPSMPTPLRLALFRIYQEALNNVARHAHATEVDVHLGLRGDVVELVVEDNGRGFEPPEDWVEPARQGRLGLVGVRERAQALGGSVQIHSRVGRGTAVQAVIPWIRDNQTIPR
jgi:PAS domain S-box-containing protein